MRLVAAGVKISDQSSIDVRTVAVIIGAMITRIVATNYRCFKELDFAPNAELNILVGDNEAGKSTVLEIISLVITGRVRGRWAAEDLNPHWFNQETVKKFFQDHKAGSNPDLPQLVLEVYFDKETDGASRLRGAHNSKSEDCPGISLSIIPDPEHADELQEYLSLGDLPKLIPTDLMLVSWRDFSGKPITRQPRGLGVAKVSVGATSNSSGVDFKLKQLLRDFVTPKEAAHIALDYRKSKAKITDGILAEVNTRIQTEDNSFDVNLKMDQTANSNWSTVVTPHIDEVPFGLLGQGRQVGTKIALAMHRSTDGTQFVLVEEPENHLSHTGLTKMLGTISDLADGRQLFITTHSSFVLNRLGFDALHLMHQARIVPMTESIITIDTIDYFKKQSGFDTLRLAIANKAVVVEGPSDEMIFNLAFERITGKSPRNAGIDVVVLGTRGKRALELAKALGKKTAVLRDNDGKDPSHWIGQAGDLIKSGEREMFVGTVSGGKTLEPQLISVNGEELLRKALDLEASDDLEKFMIDNKTESAWRLVQSGQTLKWPSYITESIDFINGD